MILSVSLDETSSSRVIESTRKSPLATLSGRLFKARIHRNWYSISTWFKWKTTAKPLFLPPCTLASLAVTPRAPIINFYRSRIFFPDSVSYTQTQLGQLYLLLFLFLNSLGHLRPCDRGRFIFIARERARVLILKAIYTLNGDRILDGFTIRFASKFRPIDFNEYLDPYPRTHKHIDHFVFFLKTIEVDEISYFFVSAIQL